MSTGDRLFNLSLLASCLAHGVLFLYSPGFKDPGPRERETPIEITYLTARVPDVALPRPELAVSRQDVDELLPDESREKIDPGKAFKPDFEPLKDKADLRFFDKPALDSSDIINIKKKITIPVLNGPLLENPSYVNYYQLLREKIKRSAYQLYTGREEGEVTVLFVATSQGSLTELVLNTPVSSPSEYLRSIAIRSIQEAAPFPVFPPELKEYDRLSFNITITFEFE
jgi:TonB family protein